MRYYLIILILLTPLISLGQNNAQLLEEYYQKGLDFYAKGEFDSANYYFKEIINNNYEREKIYSLLGDCNYELRNYIDAIYYYKKTEPINDSSTNLPVLTKIAFSYYFLESYKEAISYFDKILLRDSNSIEPLYFIGLSYFNLQEYEMAKNVFHKILLISPQNTDALFYLAKIEFEYSKNKRKALIFLNKAYKIIMEEEDSSRLIFLAENLLIAGDTNKSINCYQKFLKISPFDMKIFYKKIALQERFNPKEFKSLLLKDLDFYIKSYTDESSKQAFFYAWKSYVLLDLKRMNDAESYINNALELNQDPEYYLFLALIKSKKYLSNDRSKKEMDTGYKIPAEIKLLINKSEGEKFISKTNYQNLALIYFLFGERSKACKYLEESVKMGNNRISENTFIGICNNRPIKKDLDFISINYFERFE